MAKVNPTLALPKLGRGLIFRRIALVGCGGYSRSGYQPDNDHGGWVTRPSGYHA